MSSRAFYRGAVIRAELFVRRLRRLILRTLVPSRRRRHQRKQDITRQIWDLTEGVVMSGPFAGQRIVSSTSWSSPTPKLVGTYELELTEAVEEAIAGCPTTVVVIGAAEGYYAIGFARRLPGADVLAFDTDPKARRICRQSAVDNAVQDRVQIHGHCTPKQLQSVVGFDCLVFMDCEGCELELLDPTESPGLRSSRIIVELHDFIVPGARDRISARFDSSHHVQVITAQQRRPSDFPLLDELDGETAYRALDEGRPTEPHPMEWLSMVPKNC